MKFSDSKSRCQTQAAAFPPAEACRAAQLAFVPFQSDSTVSAQEGQSCFMKTSAAFSAASKYKDWDSLPFPSFAANLFLYQVFGQNLLQFRCHCQLYPMSGLPRFQTEQNFIAEHYRLVCPMWTWEKKGRVRDRAMEFWLQVPGSQVKISLSDQPLADMLNHPCFIIVDHVSLPRGLVRIIANIHLCKEWTPCLGCYPDCQKWIHGHFPEYFLCR